jgi:hypothetical protein
MGFSRHIYIGKYNKRPKYRGRLGEKIVSHFNPGRKRGRVRATDEIPVPKKLKKMLLASRSHLFTETGSKTTTTKEKKRGGRGSLERQTTQKEKVWVSPSHQDTQKVYTRHSNLSYDVNGGFYSLQELCPTPSQRSVQQLSSQFSLNKASPPNYMNANRQLSSSSVFLFPYR